MDTARERKFARIAQLGAVVEIGNRAGGIKPLDGAPGDCLERNVALFHKVRRGNRVRRPEERRVRRCGRPQWCSFSTPRPPRTSRTSYCYTQITERLGILRVLPAAAG